MALKSYASASLFLGLNLILFSLVSADYSYYSQPTPTPSTYKSGSTPVSKPVSSPYPNYPQSTPVPSPYKSGQTPVSKPTLSPYPNYPQPTPVPSLYKPKTTPLPKPTQTPYPNYPHPTPVSSLYKPETAPVPKPETTPYSSYPQATPVPSVYKPSVYKPVTTPLPKPTPTPYPNYPQPTPVPSFYKPETTPVSKPDTYNPYPKGLYCPWNTLKFGVCANVLNALNLRIGAIPTDPYCCPLIDGLSDFEAAVCLCTAIKAKVLGININAKISIELLLNYCGHRYPTGYECAY